MKHSIFVILFVLTLLSGFSQTTHIDSLLEQCVGKEVFCKDSISRDKILDRLDIRRDESFFRKITNSFKEGISSKKVTQIFSNHSFVSQEKTYNLTDKKVLEVLFYTNYTSGSIMYLFDKNKLISYGCDIKSDYTVYCGAKKDGGFNISGTIDIPFFKQHVIPFFKSESIKYACSRLIVQDIWNLREQIRYLQ